MDAEQEIVRSFATRFDDEESRRYALTHARRYEMLLRLVSELVAACGSDPVRLLDVGPSHETDALRVLHPVARIDSLGFLDPRFPPPRDGEQHVEYDLNRAEDVSSRPDIGPYDVIVCAEVVEHLHVSPAHVLRMFASWLRPGGRVVIQTPNAVALEHRLRLLAGRNPFEQIREDSRQAGHFREYTVAELVELGARAGLETVHAWRQNYFVTGSRKNRVLVRWERAVPPPLRQGITIELRPASG